MRTLDTELSVVQNELGLTGDNFQHFYEAEKTYFAELKDPPCEERLKIWYVEMLDEPVECQ